MLSWAGMTDDGKFQLSLESWRVRLLAAGPRRSLSTTPESAAVDEGGRRKAPALFRELACPFISRRVRPNSV